MNLKFFATIFLGVMTMLLLFIIFQNKKNQNTEAPFFPKPTNGETQIFEGQLEGEGNNAKEKWLEMIHRAAPDTDWEAIDQRTRQQFAKNKNGNSALTRTSETFGNGNLTGDWVEIGSNNQAGSLNAIDYVKSANKIYGISAGGILWNANLDGTGWTVLNETQTLQTTDIKVLNGGATILAVMNKNPAFSTNGGASFTASIMDFSSVDNWGEGSAFATLSDGTIYFMRRAWDSSPWAARMWIFRSTDGGVNFSRIKVLDPIGSSSVNSTSTRMWQPYESDEIFILHQGRDLYQIDGATVNLRNTNTDLAQEVWLDLDGNITGTDTTLYAMISKSNVYKSTNLGATWTLQGTTPVDAWNVGISVSPFDKDKLSSGGLEVYRSADGGGSWTKVNNWGAYYSDTDKLHADIMDMQTFETTASTSFTLVANHGGLHVSYDDLVTTTNIGTSGLNIGQFYDVRTDPLNSSYVYGGTQDQGHQRTSAASGASSPVNFSQVISGDYGHMAFSRNNQSMWTVYPGAWVTYYHNPQTSGHNSSYDLDGSDPAVSDWITPTSETADAVDNSIYLAGGDVSGGSGSHLVTLTALTSSPYTVSASQFSYDFKANSNSGSATISAIEPSYVDANRLYVATSDGTFFYSNDGGTTWNKAASFTGPGQYWLYGSTIFASQVTSDLVYFGGSGYSNDPVWKSTDGGATFTSMSNGLPSSLVHEIVANANETLLFAATDVGPYVYVVSENMWYSMLGTSAPVQRYYSVEYVASEEIARFGTYGRGIWDFKISAQPLPIDLIYFDVKLLDNQKVELTWSTASERDNDFFEIERSTDGTNFESIITLPSKGNTNIRQDYITYDENPLKGFNYYRLKQVDFDGKYEYFDIQQVEVKTVNATVKVFPNPIQRGDFFNVKNADVNMLLQVFDTQGRLVKEKNLQQDIRISTNDLGVGNYFYKITNIRTLEKLQTGKLVII